MGGCECRRRASPWCSSERTTQGEKAVDEKAGASRRRSSERTTQDEKAVGEKAVVFVSPENTDWYEHRRCTMLDGRKFDSRGRGLPDLRCPSSHVRALRAHICFPIGARSGTRGEIASVSITRGPLENSTHARLARRRVNEVGRFGATEPRSRVAES